MENINMNEKVELGDIVLFRYYMGIVPYKLCKINDEYMKFINLLTGGNYDNLVVKLTTKLKVKNIIEYYSSSTDLEFVRVIHMEDQKGLHDYIKYIIAESASEDVNSIKKSWLRTDKGRHWDYLTYEVIDEKLY